MDNITVSYAILTCNEYEELTELIEQLSSHIDLDDEIVVLIDNENPTNATTDIREYLQRKKKLLGKQLIVDEHPLEKQFSRQKNKLTEMCSKDYVFNIDSDEVLAHPTEFFATFKKLLSVNPDVELYKIPRINKVIGLTEEHQRKWGWRVDEEGRVNYPDLQSRIYKNDYPRIEWAGDVHEKVVGHTMESALPLESVFDLLHVKTIDRQEKQNQFYSTI